MHSLKLELKIREGRSVALELDLSFSFHITYVNTLWGKKIIDKRYDKK